MDEPNTMPDNQIIYVTCPPNHLEAILSESLPGNSLAGKHTLAA